MESFNGKLRDELLNREVFEALREAQVLIERWRREYNQSRPHSALGAGWEFIPMGWTPDNSSSNLKGGTTRGGRSGPPCYKTRMASTRRAKSSALKMIHEVANLMSLLPIM